MYNPYLIPPVIPPSQASPPQEESTQGKEQGKVPLLSKLPSISLDSGDILLALILLFLALDGEDYEVVITLALLLLMGLGDSP